MDNTNAQERVVSADTVDSLQLPVYQDPHDVKKMRNRIAQRKHRARVKRRSSQSTSRDVTGAGAGGDGASSSYHHRQECKTDVEPANKAMDFIMPGAGESGTLQNAKASTNNHPELKQFMMPSLPSLPSYDAANSEGFFHSEDVPVNQESAIFQSRYLPQTNMGTQDDHDFATLYEATQRQHQYQQLQLQLQLQAAQQLQSNTRHETDVLTSPTHTRHSRTKSLGNANLGKISQLELSATAPNVDTTGQGSSHDGSKITSITNANNNADSPSSSSGTSSGTSSPGNSRHHSPETTPPSASSTHNLEGRFERLLKAVTDAGFESIDDAATQYYTSSFKEDSSCHWAQERSRRRSLTTLLQSLQRSAKHWSERDAQAYKSHIGAVAERWYVDEFSNAKREVMNFGRANERSRFGPQSREDSWYTIKEPETNERIREKRMLMREKMPETWSLLLELTQKAGLQQPRGSQAVDGFLLLLLDNGGSG